jgi:hypothetical protein
MVICGLISALITHIYHPLLFSAEKIRAYTLQESENQILKVQNWLSHTTSIPFHAQFTPTSATN